MKRGSLPSRRGHPRPPLRNNRGASHRLYKDDHSPHSTLLSPIRVWRESWKDRCARQLFPKRSELGECVSFLEPFDLLYFLFWFVLFWFGLFNKNVVTYYLSGLFLSAPPSPILLASKLGDITKC